MEQHRMGLQTVIKIEPPPFDRLGIGGIFCGIGSCFAVELLSRLYCSGFSGIQNPNGIVYNTVAIASPILRLLENRLYSSTDFFQYENKWHSWEHHGDFSHKSLDIALENANQMLIRFKLELEKTDIFIVTPSSSVVYVHKDNGGIVANCHRVPGGQFERRMLSVEENITMLNKIVDSVLLINPLCKIIITLSPVRHYPGTLILNSLSKAHLLTAIYCCIEKFPKNTAYFPAFEILNDELRDYRFYKEDMLHPSDLAVKIILDRFLDVYFTAEAVVDIKKRFIELTAANHVNKVVQLDETI